MKNIGNLFVLCVTMDFLVLFYSLHFVYVDFDGNEVLCKDDAAVTVDGWLLLMSDISVHICSKF